MKSTITLFALCLIAVGCAASTAPPEPTAQDESASTICWQKGQDCRGVGFSNYPCCAGLTCKLSTIRSGLYTCQ